MNYKGGTIRIGTRGSKLALAQAHKVWTLLSSATGMDESLLEIVPISTTGDNITDRPLADIGGKGLFCKELEEALRDERIDLAVHSMKDMETHLPDGMTIAAVLEREDPRDAFLSADYETLELLPEGASIGTSSVRRRFELLRIRPDLKILPLRGNVTTRIQKLQSGEVDAIILAAAGLNRLGLQPHIREYLPLEQFVPSAAQGAVAIEIQEDNETLHHLLKPLNHTPTFVATQIERLLLAALDGDCRTPIGAHVQLANNGQTYTLHAMLADLENPRLSTHITEHGLQVSEVPTDITRIASQLKSSIA